MLKNLGAVVRLTSPHRGTRSMLQEQQIAKKLAWSLFPSFRRSAIEQAHTRCLFLDGDQSEVRAKDCEIH